MTGPCCDHPLREGDRVRIRADRAESFTLPYRKWGEQGRAGTVLWEVSSRLKWRELMVQFDTARPPKRPSDYRLTVFEDELERIEVCP